MFQWSDVHVFLRVASRGSFTAAAKELAMDQTTIGRHIASLETALGAKLFHRGRSGLTISPAGEEILEAARDMEHAAHAIDRRVSGRDKSIEGDVRITTAEAFGTRFLAPRIEALRQKYPKVTPTLIISPRLLSLTHREADVAVRMWKSTQPDLVARKIGHWAFSLYAAPAYVKAHPQPITDARAHAFLGFDAELAATPEAAWISERAGNRFAFRSNHFGVLERAAVGGAGIAVLPCFLADGREDLVRVGGDDLTVTLRSIWIVVHRELQRQARIRAVTDFIAAEVDRAKILLLGASRSGRSPRLA